MAVRSQTVPRLRAESTPAPTPMISQMIAAPIASRKVTGNRLTSSGHTACSVLKE